MNQPLIVKPDKTNEFISFLQANQKSEDYWNECRSTKRIVSQEVVDELKQMCKEEA